MDMEQERYAGRTDAEPEGPGFEKPYVLDDTVYLAKGAVVRSVIDPRDGRGLVVVDFGGKWNKKPGEVTLSMVIHREVANEIALYLHESVAASVRDEAEWRRRHP